MEKKVEIEFKKWPYYVGQVVLLMIAVSTVVLSEHFTTGVAFVAGVCGVLSVVCMILPYYLEYKGKIMAQMTQGKSRVSLQEEKFKKWEGVLREQLSLMQELSGKINHQMLLTEGLVQRADRKLESLEVMLEDLKERERDEEGEEETDKVDLVSVFNGEEEEVKEENVGGEDDFFVSNEDEDLIKIEVFGDDTEEVDWDKDVRIEEGVKIVIQEEEEVEEEVGSYGNVKISTNVRIQPKVEKTGNSEVVIIANVMIGLGNKPYVRGVGGGLREDKGVAMEFMEIGKWVLKIENAVEEVDFQIYKNDEERDAVVYSVNRGEKIEIFPNFPVKNSIFV